MAQTAKPPLAPAGAKLVVLWSAVALVAVGAGLAVPELYRHQNTQPAVAEPAGGEKLAYTPPLPPDFPDSGMLLLRLVVGTVLVLGLCAGTLWIGKRWLAVGPAAPGQSGQLHLVETLVLGNRCLVYLVQAGSQQVLVGVDRVGMRAMIPLHESFEAALDRAGPDEERPEPAAGRLVSFKNPHR